MHRAGVRRLGPHRADIERRATALAADYLALEASHRDPDAAADAAAKKKGLTSGFKASLEFRTFVASHSDTVAEGPVTAAQLVSEAQ